MKKILAIVISTLLVLTLFVACTAKEEKNPDTTTANPSATNGSESTVLQDAELTTYDDRLPSDSESPATQAPSTTTITSDEAKAIVLGHAGLTESEVSRYHSELDRERGGLVYEIEFDSATHEYEYEVNAETGEVLKAEKEYRD